MMRFRALPAREKASVPNVAKVAVWGIRHALTATEPARDRARRWWTQFRSGRSRVFGCASDLRNWASARQSSLANRSRRKGLVLADRFRSATITNELNVCSTVFGHFSDSYMHWLETCFTKQVTHNELEMMDFLKLRHGCPRESTAVANSLVLRFVSYALSRSVVSFCVGNRTQAPIP
jgi:hypothetical protein